MSPFFVEALKDDAKPLIEVKDSPIAKSFALIVDKNPLIENNSQYKGVPILVITRIKLCSSLYVFLIKTFQFWLLKVVGNQIIIVRMIQNEVLLDLYTIF
jgi:hypothetical protein